MGDQLRLIKGQSQTLRKVLEDNDRRVAKIEELEALISKKERDFA